MVSTDTANFFSKGRQELCQIFIRKRNLKIQLHPTQLRTTTTSHQQKLQTTSKNATPTAKTSKKLREKPLGGWDTSIYYFYRVLKLLDIFLD